MDYRVAIQISHSSTWKWKSTALSSLDALFRWFHVYGHYWPHDHLRVFSCSSREGFNEQLICENRGLGSPSVTAAHFLQERLILFPGVTPRTATVKAQEHREAGATALLPNTWSDERNNAVHAGHQQHMSLLERRRLELELGAGGDHDAPYTFALPPSMPQALLWMRLLTRVHSGELQS